MEDSQEPPHIARWLIWGGILLLLYQMILPGRLLGQEYPVDTTVQFDVIKEVLFCHRLVDDWRLQLLLPGVEHYSIWLPKKKLHRGLVADGLGYPLQWVNEIYLDENESKQDILSKGLSCEVVSNVDSSCVEREVMRQQDEGRYGLTNHCQHPIIEILGRCSEAS